VTGYTPSTPSINPAVHGQQLNSQSVDHKYDALTDYNTKPPCDFYRYYDNVIFIVITGDSVIFILMMTV